MEQLIKQITEEYPDHFFDFTGGTNITEKQIIKWIIKELIKTKQEIIDQQLDQNFFSIASGNTIVFGEIYRQENGKFQIEINVCKNYLNGTFHNVEF